MSKRSVAFVLAVGFLTACGTPEWVQLESARVFVGARIIDGTGGNPIDDGVLVVRDGRIEAVGTSAELTVPEGATLIDVAGKTIIPGLINTHGHVNGTLGLETNHFTRENLLRQLRLYARYGVTTVNSLGGDQEVSAVIRDAQNTKDLRRSRLLIAGSVVSGSTPEAAHAMVEKNLALKADFIKIRVDDGLGRGKKMTPEVYESVIDRAHQAGLPVAAHLVYLEDAIGLAQADVDYIAHSIRDKVVDDGLIALLKEKDITYCPTLMREVSVYAYESVPDFFEDPFFLKAVDPAVIEQLKNPERMSRIKNSQSAQWFKKHLSTAMENLRKLADGGVTIAFGTDTGPPGRFQGYFEHMELSMMASAGLSPMQILSSATGNAAKAIGREDIGTLESGKWADFLVLEEDPLLDISNTRSIETVWIAGNKVGDE
ncbi:MAG: amidohydrolase family protein [Gemmatimonadota bacterium]|nr:amidohydrolase family protein [Gemmatimonadota bacterium]